MATAGEVKKVIGRFSVMLKQWRDLKGLSQAGAARELDVSLNNITSWEQGKRRPTLDDETLSVVERIFDDLKAKK